MMLNVVWVYVLVCIFFCFCKELNLFFSITDFTDVPPPPSPWSIDDQVGLRRTGLNDVQGPRYVLGFSFCNTLNLFFSITEFRVGVTMYYNHPPHDLTTTTTPLHHQSTTKQDHHHSWASIIKDDQAAPPWGMVRDDECAQTMFKVYNY